MSENAELKWYVVHTYSGYENKVKANLEKSVVNNGMTDLIHEIEIPLETAVEIKNNKRKAQLCSDPHGDDQRNLVPCAQYPRRDRICWRG